MHRTFLTLPAVILTFLASVPSAFAMVLKDVDAEPGVSRTGVLIVGESTFINSWESTELGPSVVTGDAYAKRLAESFVRKTGVHYVEVLTGSEATQDGTLSALKRMQGEQLETFVFSYRGFGLGADTHESCITAADWDHTKPFTTCISADTINELGLLIAKRQLIILDASIPAPASVTAAIKADMFGPTADDWPVTGDTAVISSGKTQRYVECGSFASMLTTIVGNSAPEDALTFGTMTSQLDVIAKSPKDTLPAGVEQCTTPIQPTVEATWFSDVVVIPGTMVAAPEPQTVPLPTDPLTAPTKATKKIGTPTVASLIATGVCAAVGGASWAYGEHRLNQYNDPTWAAENFPGDDVGRIAAGEAEIPTYGYLAVGGFSCAGIGAAASGLTWYFGK